MSFTNKFQASMPSRGSPRGRVIARCRGRLEVWGIMVLHESTASPRKQSCSEQTPVLPFRDTAWGAKAYAAALDLAAIFCITDPRGRILHANDGFVRISGYARDELLGSDFRTTACVSVPRKFFDGARRALGKSNERWRSPISCRAKDGSVYWVDATVVPLERGTGKVEAYLYLLIDITDAVKKHVELQEYTALVQGVLDNFPSGIVVYDKDLNLVFCNETQKRLMELPDHLFADGKANLERICRFNAERGEYGEGEAENHVRARIKLARKKKAHVYERKRPNGVELEVRGTPIHGGGFIATYIDITGRKQDQETIARLALHDMLTGLPNRRLMLDRLEKGMTRVARGEKLAFLAMDLDRFKCVNDLFGHPVGDKLLQAVAKRIESSIRETDTIARFGGDEFSIIMTGNLGPTHVERVARRIVNSIAKPFKIGGHSLSIGASIGIAMAPNDASDAQQLMTNADLALYRAKANGRGTFCFFEREMQERAQMRHVVQEGLRASLARNEFELHYQPIVRIADREIIGCEALIRWSHGKRGLIPASEFIPIAEETGLIGQIGEWVLKRACAEAAHWPEGITVAVNISPAQFRGQDLALVVTNSLNGLHPSRLVLEITESLLLQNSEANLETLRNLRDMGVRFALDDFGTGFSSLSYLQGFPFDKIKIDRSFVSNVTSVERSSTLRRSIAQLGRSLGMTTVAEGVETETQLEMLRSEGCMEAQGYLFSRPIPAKELRKVFEKPI